MKDWATMVKKIKLNAHMHDKLSVTQFIAEFNFKEGTRLPSDDMRVDNLILTGALETIDVNNLQMACAQIIYHLTADK